MRRQSNSSEAFNFQSFIRPVCFGVGSALVVCLVLLFIFSFLMSKMDISASLISPITIAITAVTGFVSGFVCARITRKNGLVMGAICSAILFLIFWLFSAICLKEGISVLGIVKLVLLVVSGCLGGVLGVNKKERRRK